MGAGAVAGWLSRVTGRGQGATISGRVMNSIAPHLLTELARGRARHARVGDERQDDDDPLACHRARECRRRPQRHQQLDRREPHVGHRADARAGHGTRRRRARGRRTRAGPRRRPAARRAAGARQPQPRPARPLRRGARRRRCVASSRRSASRARRHRQRVRSPCRVGRSAGEGHLGRARVSAGAPTPPRARRAGSCSTGRADRFECPHASGGCGFAQPDAPNRLEGDTLMLDGDGDPAAARAPGPLEPRERRARRDRGSAPRRRSRRGCCRGRRPSRRSPGAT